MEKERGYKVVVIALLIAVVGVGIGFAAFSATFTIEEAPVTVNPNEKLLENNMHYTGVINESVLSSNADMSSLIADTGTAKDRTWSGIAITMNEDNLSNLNNDHLGQASIEAEIINESNYTAYLTDLSFINGNHTPNAKLVCEAEEGTSQKLVDDFCSDESSYNRFIFAAQISLKSMTDSEYSDEDILAVVYNDPDYNDDSISSVPIEPGQKIYVGFGIIVFSSLGSDKPLPDGPFKMYVPNLEFKFSTTNPASSNN